jgi:Arc/MetJ-type ribon-helix-helix transcriptional regulator
MNAPSTAISMRITDEELALLDSRIGLDGARSRSDVIRAAIREYLTDQPLLADMDQVKVTIGRRMKLWLGQLYETQGITPQNAAQQGLQNHVRALITEEDILSQAITASVDDARQKTIHDADFRQ